MIEESILGPAVPDFTITYQSRPYGLEVDSSDYGTNAYISAIKNTEKNKDAVMNAQIILVGKTDIRNMKHTKILEILASEPLPAVIGFTNPPVMPIEGVKSTTKEEKSKYDVIAKSFTKEIIA